MAKKQSFADKASKKAYVKVCPVCENPVQYIKIVKPVESSNGAYKMKEQNVGVCNCKHSDDPNCIANRPNIFRESEIFN